MNSKKIKKSWVYYFIFFGISIITTLLLFHISFHKSSIDFKRIKIVPRETYNENTLKRYHLKQFKFNNGNYIYAKSSGTTLNGSLLILKGLKRKKRIDFSPNLKGIYNFRLEVLVITKKRKVSMQIFHNSIEIKNRQFSKEGIHNFCFDLKLKKDSKFSIISSGRGVIIVGNPIFYKKKPVDQRAYVFLICVDTLRADHLPTYGYNRETAPNIHFFSKDSVVFEYAYAQAPWTLPSHMSLFTSLYEYNHGVKKESPLSSHKDFLIEELSSSFATRSINGGGWLRAGFGFYRGFDNYSSDTRCGTGANSAKILFENTLKDLKQNHFPRSFYFLHTYQVHSPYKPKRQFLEYFNPNPQYKKMVTPLHLNNKKISIEEANKIRLPMIDLYDGEIRSFDHWFEKFLQDLKRKKIYNKSMIILTSDHGEEFFDHYKWGHGHSLYNEVTRIPLIIKFPQNKYKGIKVKATVGLIDIMPTILNYYHLDFKLSEPKAKLDGSDLIPVIKGKELKRPLISSITSGFTSPVYAYQVAIIKNNQKIIYHTPYIKTNETNVSPKIEFYDLLKNPGETINLYLRQMHKVKKIQNLLDRIISTGAYNLKKKSKKIFLDRKMHSELQALGYL